MPAIPGLTGASSSANSGEQPLRDAERSRRRELRGSAKGLRTKARDRHGGVGINLRMPLPSNCSGAVNGGSSWRAQRKGRIGFGDLQLARMSKSPGAPGVSDGRSGRAARESRS